MSLIDLSDKERRLAERVDNVVTNGLAVSDAAGGIAFDNAGQLLEFSKLMAIANSGVRKHLRGNPGACLAICVQAVEWGLSPFAVANKSYFVNDQIAFESQLIQAVILKRAPIKGRIKFEFIGSGLDRVCRAWARLREDDEIVEYISPPLKSIYPQNSPLWKSDPDQQMCYSAGRALCRRHFPDVLLGVYAEDELPVADRARDVTPARSTQSRLDALASKPAPDPVDPPHDPDTGEIVEAEPADDAFPGDETPRDKLLATLRGKILSGARVMGLLSVLSPADRALVTAADEDALHAAEKAVAAQAAPGK